MLTLGHAPAEPDRTLDEIADEHLRSVPQLARISVLGQGQEVDGELVRHRLDATGELKGGEPVEVAQWVVAGARRQVFALALWPAGTPADVRAACAAVARSVAMTNR
ncbi:MAG: hypothetical protein R3F59_27475 [Myxococcota bacterium]